MEITTRDLVTFFHGAICGGFFLMALYGVGVEVFFNREHTVRRWYLRLLVAVAWLTVLSGAYVVYPWYRAVPPAGAASLASYPQRFLLSNPDTAGWHELGMNWKEHIAWMAALLTTAAAYLLGRYKGSFKEQPGLRLAATVFLATALFSAGVAAVFGVMLSKLAPVQGGPMIHLLRFGR